MSQRPVLVDDDLLIRTLLGEEPPALRSPGVALFTTGIWYHRLARALAVPALEGGLSRRLGGRDVPRAGAVLAAVLELPDEVGLLSLRELAWPMGALLAEGHRLNLMSLEALAAALHLGAEICLSERGPNPNLEAAAAEVGVSIRSIAA